MTAEQEKLSKPQALAHWDSLSPDTPIHITPIDSQHSGTTFTEDTIRLTGSREFIDSVLANLKGILEYESGESRLEIMYIATRERPQQGDDGKSIQGQLTGAYACYVKAKSRGRGQGRPRKNGQPKEQDTAAVLESTAPEKTINRLKDVNAGLKLRNGLRELKAKEEATTKAKPAKQTAPAYTDPLYAIASSFTDDDGNVDPQWLEPIDHPILPCQTYDDICSFDDAIEEAMKKAKLKRKDIHKVEILVKDDGTLSFEEF